MPSDHPAVYSSILNTPTYRNQISYSSSFSLPLVAVRTRDLLVWLEHQLQHYSWDSGTPLLHHSRNPAQLLGAQPLETVDYPPPPTTPYYHARSFSTGCSGLRAAVTEAGTFWQALVSVFLVSSKYKLQEKLQVKRVHSVILPKKNWQLKMSVASWRRLSRMGKQDRQTGSSIWLGGQSCPLTLQVSCT
jgi:hypothetical protein